MPNKPGTEPTLEELSAYVDGELDATTQAQVAQHVAGCADCQQRLEGIRQTAYAIRGLPMETPQRSFSLPEVRRRGWRWAPAGWVGGVAVAALIVVVGVTHLNPGAQTASGTTAGGFGAASNAGAAARGAAAPLTQSNQDLNAAKAFAPVNIATATDPQDPSRSLTVATDAASYPGNGVIQLRVSIAGLSVNEASSVRLWLVRDRGAGGYATRLQPPVKESGFPFNYTASYALAAMSLQPPVAGKYTLQVEIQLASGAGLITYVPLTITS